MSIGLELNVSLSLSKKMSSWFIRNLAGTDFLPRWISLMTRYVSGLSGVYTPLKYFPRTLVGMSVIDLSIKPHSPNVVRSLCARTDSRVNDFSTQMLTSPVDENVRRNVVVLED